MRFKQFGPQVLREYNRDITAQKLGNALLAKFQREPKSWQDRILPMPANPSEEGTANIIHHLLVKLEQFDPTANKQYVAWLARAYAQGDVKFEDMSKYTPYLAKFFKLVQKKKIPVPQNDINRYRGLPDLSQVVDQFPDVVDEPKNVDRGSAEEVYRDADVRVIKPNDEKASCYYGQGTRWCTAGRDNNMFDQYAKSGPLYIVIPTKPSHPGEKYQFHFEAKQFMDENDRQTDIPSLLDRFPQLRDLFRATAERTGAYAFLYSPEQFDTIEQDVKSQLTKQLSTYLKNTASTEAKKLARDVVRSDSLVRDIIDYEELYAMIETSLTHSWDLAKQIAYQSSPNDWGNIDGMYDLIFNLTGDWMRKEEFWMYVEELDEIDPDVFQHAGMTLEGDLSTLVSGAIEKVLPGIIKDATSRL